MKIKNSFTHTGYNHTTVTFKNFCCMVKLTKFICMLMLKSNASLNVRCDLLLYAVKDRSDISELFKRKLNLLNNP